MRSAVLPARTSAIVLAVVVASGCGSATPTQAPSAVAPTTAPQTAAPQPTEVPRLTEDGPIEPGTYLMSRDPSFLVTVPAGWESGGLTIRKHFDQSDEVTAFDAYTKDIRVFADACQSEGTEAPIGPTVDDLVAALEAQENSVVSDPVEISIGGLPGVRLEVSAPASLDTTTCSIGSLQIWRDRENGGGFMAGVVPGFPASIYAVDTPGGRFQIALGSGGTAADAAEREAMIASIQFVE